jgi:hypothetical protein
MLTQVIQLKYDRAWKMKLRAGIQAWTEMDVDSLLGEPEVHEHAAEAVQEPAHLRNLGEDLQEEVDFL